MIFIFMIVSFQIIEICINQEGYYDYSNSKIKGDYKLTGKKYFSVSELEVYEIIFFE